MRGAAVPAGKRVDLSAAIVTISTGFTVPGPWAGAPGQRIRVWGCPRASAR